VDSRLKASLETQAAVDTAAALTALPPWLATLDARLGRIEETLARLVDLSKPHTPRAKGG
jgi:hypothetical protein